LKLQQQPAKLSQGLVLLSVGAIGGLAAQGMGIPAGMVVGALLASGLYRLAGGDEVCGVAAALTGPVARAGAGR